MMRHSHLVGGREREIRREEWLGRSPEAALRQLAELQGFARKHAPPVGGNPQESPHVQALIELQRKFRRLAR